MYPQQFVQGAAVACALLLAGESLVNSGQRCHKDHTGSHKTLTKCLLQLSDCYNTNNCQQAWLIMKTLDVASIMCQQCDQEESHSDAQLQQKIISI